MRQSKRKQGRRGKHPGEITVAEALVSLADSSRTQQDPLRPLAPESPLDGSLPSSSAERRDLLIDVRRPAADAEEEENYYTIYKVF